MNDTVHGHMVQDLLRHRFGSHDNLICKYSSKYPVQAEREFQRLTNAYIRILNELLKEYPVCGRSCRRGCKRRSR